MKYLIIGSVAFNVAVKSVNTSLTKLKCGDVDVICDHNSYVEFITNNASIISFTKRLSENKRAVKLKNNVIIEFELISEGSLKLLFEIINNDVSRYTNTSDVEIPGFKYFDVHFANINLLYAFKMSHRYLKNSRFFLKTMNDIFILKSINAQIDKSLLDWYSKREAETYYYSHPALNQSKDDFFNTKGVKYKYDHDSIHEAIAILDKPAYTYFKPDENEVYCSKEMFDALDDNIKRLAVIEESCVLALERSIVPYGFKNNADEMFKYALQKVCTSITSGWFREYAYDHYYEIYGQYTSYQKDWYYTKFVAGIYTNKVKKYEN